MLEIYIKVVGTSSRPDRVLKSIKVEREQFKSVRETYHFFPTRDLLHRIHNCKLSMVQRSSRSSIIIRLSGEGLTHRQLCTQLAASYGERDTHVPYQARETSIADADDH